MNNKRNNKNQTPFTVNAEFTSDMPTVSTLLNRKKLIISDKSRDAQDITKSNLSIKKPNPPANSPSNLLMKSGTYSDPDSNYSFAEDSEQVQSKVLPAARRKTSPNIQQIKSEQFVKLLTTQSDELLHWDRKMMTLSPNPYANAIAQVMSLAKEGIYLSISTDHFSKKSAPLFKSHAAYSDTENRMAQLTGIYWDPDYHPDLWKALLKTGVAESTTSEHEPLKAKFGYSKEAFLLLALVGPPTACRGLSVFATQESIKGNVLKILAPLYQVPKKVA